MTEAMPFLQKYDITFFRPPPIWRREFFVKYITAHFARRSRVFGERTVDCATFARKFIKFDKKFI